MTSVKEVYDMVNDLSDKNNGRYLTSEEFTRYAQTSNLELYDERIGATNKVLNNQSNVSYGKAQPTDQTLEVFKANKIVQIINGEGNLGTDVGKINAVSFSKRNRKSLIRIDDDRVGSIFDNPLREPNEEDIYYLDGKNIIEVFGNIQSVYISYLRVPKDPVYAEKEIAVQVGNRTVKRKVYDPDSSVDFEWDKRQMLDLVTRILQKAGIPMKDGFIEQMVNINKSNE